MLGRSKMNIVLIYNEYLSYSILIDIRSIYDSGYAAATYQQYFL